VWIAFAAMGGLLAIYLVLLVLRTSAADSTWCGWLVDGFEAAASALCIACGLTRRPGRWIALTLGLGSMAWALGDFAITIESLHGAEPAVPSAADAFYIFFFPLTYVAIVLAMRGEVRRLSTPSWLDGGVAGLGAAAVCAEFAFHTVLKHAGGDGLAVATNLTYPVGDLLLLALIVGGSAVLSGRRKMPWVLLASGVAINVIGDTFALFGADDPSNLLGHTCDAMAWPASLLLISMSVWLRARPTNPLLMQKPGGFALPGLAATAGLVILVAGAVSHPNLIAVGLACATLVLVGVRLAVSVAGLRTLTEQRLHQSLTDELTGLGNRRYLFQVLDAFFAEQSQLDVEPRSLSFLFLDLNHFKEINDSFGHPAGDELLRQLGPRLNTALRACDALVRLGGDEFAVVLIDIDADGAVAVANRIAESLMEPFDLDVVRAAVGASIGIAVAPHDADDSAGLLWCADVAMYRAKSAGAAYALYDQDLDDEGHQWRLVEELRLAIATGQLVLHYQPQLDLQSGQVRAVEALVRWPHPRLGLIAPVKFLPIAEEAGLMGELTRLVLTKALLQCAAWRAEGRDVSVAVNVSPSSLLEPGFINLVTDSLRAQQLPPEALIIEITETSVVADFERSNQVIGTLREVGVIVSIDDFGAGFTSLAHLSSLAVGELKLDRAFITGLGIGGERHRDLQLVRATIELGHTMGLRVVAEGIEDAETLQLLVGLGCDLAQGYYISTPKPADELEFTPRVVAASAQRAV
jgi:diguanylate cyclase (GGDEF)-like protein